jgi:putative two-component system response regulator
MADHISAPPWQDECVNRFSGGLEEPLPEVLVAEDDGLSRRFLQEALELGEHSVTIAADGIEAITRIDKPGCFDVVVTDYAMPRANGLDVITHAHRVDPMLPCVIVTAFRDLDLAMKAMQAGAIAFLPKPFKPEHLLTIVDRALERRDLAAEALRLRFLAPMLERFTMVLANTLESKDIGTQRHANRLVHLSDAIATQLELPDDLRSAIRYGACLHDIGKVAIPEELLRKPTKLTDDERDLMRTHPTVGASILEDIETWDDVRLIVRHHHEHYDGGGYPDGLHGAQIPLGARIVSVVDAFDVMRSGRPYADALPHEEIIDELRRQRRRQFDPEIVDTLLEVITEDDMIPADDAAELSGGPVFLPRPDIAVAGWLAAEVEASSRRARVHA